MLWQINVHEIVEVVLIFNAPSTQAGRQPRSAELIMSLRHFRANDIADLSTDDVPLRFIPPTDHNMQMSWLSCRCMKPPTSPSADAENCLDQKSLIVSGE